MIKVIYIKVRNRIRSFVIKYKFLDRYFGNILVGFDQILRSYGILNKDLSKGFIKHNNFKIFYGEEDKSLISFIITNNNYEKLTREAIERILRPGDTFLDLGANIGYFTLIASRLVKEEGRVLAFEPTPSTLIYLKKNIKENNFMDRVIIEEYAISNKNGKVHFLVNNNNSECNSVIQNFGEDTITVDAVTLDSYFKNKKNKSVDLIKMDIEGQELQALEGMSEINLMNGNLKIIFEYHKENIKKNKMSGLEIFTLLQSYGFNRFTVLFRKEYEIKIPDDFHIINRDSKRENLNILAEKIY